MDRYARNSGPSYRQKESQWRLYRKAMHSYSYQTEQAKLVWSQLESLPRVRERAFQGYSWPRLPEKPKMDTR